MNQHPQEQPTIEFAGFKCLVGRQAQGLPTAAQVQVLAGLAAGWTQKEIARARGVSPATIKSTADTVRYWLRVDRATAAVAQAMRKGWIAPLLLALIIGSLSPNQPVQRVRQPVRVVRMQRNRAEVMA